MRRALGLLTSTAAVIALGCGINSYESRITNTEKTIKEQIRLDHFLGAAPTGKFQESGFFVRPPKPLSPAPKFALASLVDGMYDADGSFLASGKEAAGVNLHVLGRRKLAKKAPSKKPTAADTAPRGPFTQDVQGVLGSAYGSQAPAELKTTTVTKEKNAFKRQIFPLSGNPNTANVHVYYYNEKVGQDTYDAALIWERPEKVPPSLEEAIDLTLKSFAVGPKATRAFSGEATDEGAAGGEGGPAAPF